MSEPSDQRVADLDKRLEAVSQTLSTLHWPTRDEADRVGARFDRLASEIAAISPKLGSATPDDVGGFD